MRKIQFSLRHESTVRKNHVDKKINKKKSFNSFRNCILIANPSMILPSKRIKECEAFEKLTQQ